MAKKSNPGHYCAMPRGPSYVRMQEAICDNLKGFQMRFSMRELEPQQGKYNLTPIDDALKFCERNSLQLIVMILDKAFTKEPVLPDYMKQYAIATAKGSTMARWMNYPMSRLKALIRAIAARYDQHPHLEGIALQESSLGINDNKLAALDYTPEMYRQQLISTMNVKALPHTAIFWYMNFLPWKQVYIADVRDALIPMGNLMGGPDWLPEGGVLKRTTYPFYPPVKDKMNTFISAQYDSYCHLHHKAGAATKYWTPRELFDSAKAQLFVDYFLWTWFLKPRYADSYCYTDAKPVIEAGW